MLHQVVLRAGPLPDDTILMVRAGLRGVEVAKLRSDAERSQRVIGILGVSVQSSLPGESLAEAWVASKILAERPTVWWSTAGALRGAQFPLLATGTDVRHYTVALAHTGDELLERLAGLFRMEAR